MASGKPKNIGEALFGAAGDALNFMAANWGAGQQQKKENALTAYMTSMKAAEQERSVLQHDLMMRQAQQNILASQLEYKEKLKASLLTPEQKAEQDAKAQLARDKVMREGWVAPDLSNVKVPEGYGAFALPPGADITRLPEPMAKSATPALNPFAAVQLAGTMNNLFGGAGYSFAPDFKGYGLDARYNAPNQATKKPTELDDKTILVEFNKARGNVISGHPIPPHLRSFSAYKQWILSGEGTISPDEEIDEDEAWLQSEGY